MSRAQKIDKVIKGLKKASKLHAGQAKTLESIEFKKGGKTKSKVNEAGNYTKPAMRKRQFQRIKGYTPQSIASNLSNLLEPASSLASILL